MQAAVLDAVARTVPDLRLVNMTKPQALGQLKRLKTLCFSPSDKEESFSVEDLRTMYKQNRHLQTTVIQRRGNTELFGVAVYGITSAPTLFASAKLVDRIVAFQIGNVVVSVEKERQWAEVIVFCTDNVHLRQILLMYTMAKLSNKKASVVLIHIPHADKNRSLLSMLSTYGFQRAHAMRKSERADGLTRLLGSDDKDASDFLKNNYLYGRVQGKGNTNFLTQKEIKDYVQQAPDAPAPPAPKDRKRKEQETPRAPRPPKKLARKKQPPVKVRQQYPFRECGKNVGPMSDDALRGRIYQCFRKGFGVGYFQAKRDAE